MEINIRKESSKGDGKEGKDDRRKLVDNRLHRWADQGERTTGRGLN